MNPKDNRADEVDDLIMRMKDCISHEDKHDQQFTDRCITKVQFKQKMKALIERREKAARVDELESNRNQTGFDVGSIILTKDDVDDRIKQLSTERGEDE